MKNTITILANGEFPNKIIAEKHLNHEDKIICADGAANKLIGYGIKPFKIIGDLDSIKKHLLDENIINTPNQNKTDLDKSLEWCLYKNYKNINILGASGLREDHFLANLYLLHKYKNKLNLKIITNYSVITVEEGFKTYSSYVGELLSIFAIDKINSITTTGLKFELNNTTIIPSSLGVSNESTNKDFSIDTSSPLWLLRNHKGID
tara:strand:- start:60 stop:677 length:618 start_codon:yes stop_codon:yes gene_type:complete